MTIAVKKQYMPGFDNNYLVGGNRIAALAFIWTSNPLFFYLDYHVGVVVMRAVPWLAAPGQIEFAWSALTLTNFGQTMFACLVGGLTFGITLGCFVFIGTYWAAVAAQGKKQRVEAG